MGHEPFSSCFRRLERGQLANRMWVVFLIIKIYSWPHIGFFGLSELLAICIIWHYFISCAKVQVFFMWRIAFISGSFWEMRHFIQGVIHFYISGKFIFSCDFLQYVCNALLRYEKNWNKQLFFFSQSKPYLPEEFNAKTWRKPWLLSI